MTKKDLIEQVKDKVCFWFMEHGDNSIVKSEETWDRTTWRTTLRLALEAINEVYEEDE